MKITSAYANKMLKQLTEEKEFWEGVERGSCLYTAAVGEEPVIPEYNFREVNAKLTELSQKICKIKHSINLANVSSAIPVGEQIFSVDEILVQMTLLNKRKGMLDFMRKQQEKSRKEDYRYSAKTLAPEYQYINYDMAEVRAEYEAVSRLIIDLQMALDKHNQTFEFEVEM